MQLTSHIDTLRNRLDSALEKFLPAENSEPKILHKAMRYSVFNGGKRIRPLLVYIAGETFGAELADLDIPAAAIELVHCYSLIHDDLPAMDNDDMRRGKPTCHKQFDEATAILAGDALYNLAMQLLVDNELPAEVCKKMAVTLTKASGSLGMAGGQAIDLDSVGKQLTLAQLENMHNLKTGCLIRASIKLGAIIAGANPQQLQHLDEFGKTIGLIFQIQDDIFDIDEITDNKVSYVSLLGIKRAQAKLAQLQQQATNTLQQIAKNTSALNKLTQFIMDRES